MMTPKRFPIFSRAGLSEFAAPILFVGYADRNHPVEVCAPPKVATSVSLVLTKPPANFGCQSNNFNQRAASREFAVPTRQKTRPKENSARARRSASSGMDAGTDWQAPQ